MSDPTFPPEAYISAYDVVRHLGENYAIQYQTDGDKWDRDTMQMHVNIRSAIIKVQQLLLDAVERAAGGEGI